jgi:hypothetical protein
LRQGALRSRRACRNVLSLRVMRVPKGGHTNKRVPSEAIGMGEIVLRCHILAAPRASARPGRGSPA